MAKLIYSAIASLDGYELGAEKQLPRRALAGSVVAAEVVFADIDTVRNGGQDRVVKRVRFAGGLRFHVR